MKLILLTLLFSLAFASAKDKARYWVKNDQGMLSIEIVPQDQGKKKHFKKVKTYKTIKAAQRFIDHYFEKLTDTDPGALALKEAEADYEKWEQSKERKRK